MPSFPRSSGLQCQSLSFWDLSGEDASLFPINLDPGGRWLTAYMREGVSLWTGAFTPEPPVLRLGTDDRVFRLERVDASTCAALERAIPDPRQAGLILRPVSRETRSESANGQLRSSGSTGSG